MNLEGIGKNEAVNFIRKYHYSKILPRITKEYIGFFEDDKLFGVVTLGWGTQPLQTIRKIFYKNDFKTKDYIEIGKMCFLPQMNGNKAYGTQVLSALVKYLRKNKDYKFLYTMADGIMGKVGYVYQAASFIYLGDFKTSVYMDTVSGEKIHPRSAKELCKENALFSGKQKVFWLTQDFCQTKGIIKINGKMFRYIFPLTKEAKKIIVQYEEYQKKPYPKEKDLMFEKRLLSGKYEPIPMPSFNMKVFEHNHQKPKDRGVEQLNLFDGF